MKLLLIGFNTRPLAESAVRAGCNVVSLDYFGDLDHALLCPVYSPRRPLPGYPAGGRVNMERLTEWGLFLAQRGAWDHLVYASGFENRPDLLRVLLKGDGRLMGNSPQSLEALLDPVALFSVLHGAGYRAPRAYLTGGVPDDRGGSWIIKPLRSGGGRGVRLKEPGEAVPEGSICQEYITGKPGSFSFVADGSSSLVLGISEQLTGTGTLNGREFGYSGNLFPLRVPDPEHLLATLEGIARRLTITFKLKGLNGVDFIFDGENCWVIEVNPRYSASMELFDLAYGTPLFKLHLMAARGRWREVEQLAGRLPIRELLHRPGTIWGKKVIYTGSTVMVNPLLEGRFESEGDWASRMCNLGLRDLPFPGEIISAGNPVATALAAGEGRAACLSKLEAVSDLMKNQLCPVDPGMINKPEGERHENDTYYRADA